MLIPVRHRFLLCVLVALAACGRGSTSQTDKAEAETAGGAPALESATAERILMKVREPGATAVVMNIWATWCIPCREEFPDLMRVRREYERRGLRVVLVSADFPDQS
jgi:thiol-disulfide isomerase/thioredoxin